MPFRLAILVFYSRKKEIGIEASSRGPTTLPPYPTTPHCARSRADSTSQSAGTIDCIELKNAPFNRMNPGVGSLTPSPPYPPSIECKYDQSRVFVSQQTLGPEGGPDGRGSTLGP